MADRLVINATGFKEFEMLPFLKMQGLGNDFVIFDRRRESNPLNLTPAQIRYISDRRIGVGCDQLIMIEAAFEGSSVDAVMRIFNADGSQVQTCGNATRCVGKLLFAETGRAELTLDTLGGRLHLTRTEAGMVAVDLGLVKTEWQQIPLAQMRDSLAIADFADLGLPLGVATNVGNPHISFFVADLEAVDLARIGPIIENHRLFPERINVGIAEIQDRSQMRLRVWERGVGLTRACGSGATAAWVAAIRLGLGQGEGLVHLDGGDLWIDWRDDGHAIMTGTASHSFSGTITDLPQ
ncbi:MAG: diaminopimelate epimerase [Candidatus Pacebacteria bacterium]|nr:diaminopimelate epimerase [Candidatus Paceibacterota bacterium]